MNGLATLLAVLTALYATPLLGWSVLEGESARLALAVTVMVGGFLFCWPLLAVDWGPVARPLRDRALLAAFAVLLVIALTLFVRGAPPGPVPPADQVAARR